MNLSQKKNSTLIISLFSGLMVNIIYAPRQSKIDHFFSPKKHHPYNYNNESRQKSSIRDALSKNLGRMNLNDSLNENIFVAETPEKSLRLIKNDMEKFVKEINKFDLLINDLELFFEENLPTTDNFIIKNIQEQLIEKFYQIARSFSQKNNNYEFTDITNDLEYPCNLIINQKISKIYDCIRNSLNSIEKITFNLTFLSDQKNNLAILSFFKEKVINFLYQEFVGFLETTRIEKLFLQQNNNLEKNAEYLNYHTNLEHRKAQLLKELKVIEYAINTDV